MARWATTVTIGGVDFTGCRAEIIDGEPFFSEYVGSVDYGNDKTVHAQVVNRGTKGVAFGIQFVSSEQGDIEDLVDAVRAAQGSNATFNTTITDGIFEVNVNSIPDYNQSKGWLTLGKHSEGWYENMLIRVISK